MPSWPSTRTEAALARLALLGVLAVAFTLRYSGIPFGFPLETHPDEPYLLRSAAAMLQSGNLDPHFFNYPSLYIYLQAALQWVIVAVGRRWHWWRQIGEVSTPTILFWGRLMTVALSTATVLVVFDIGRRLQGWLAGLAAAAVVACSPLHVVNGFYITVDTPMALFATVAIWAATRELLAAPRWSTSIVGGVAVGLAIGSKYTAVLAAIPLLLIHWRHNRRAGRWWQPWTLALLVLIPVVFFLTTPYALLDPGQFARALYYEGIHYRTGHPGFESSGHTSFLFYARVLATSGLGLVGAAFAVVGWILLYRRDRWQALVLASFPVAYFLFVGQYKVRFDRNALVLVGMTAVFAGIGIERTGAWLGRRARPGGSALPALVLVLLTVALPVRSAARRVAALTEPDRRWLAQEWIETHLPEGARIAREHATPPLSSGRFHVADLGPDGLITAQCCDSYEYLVASGGDYQRYLAAPNRYPKEAKLYRELFARYQLLKEFDAPGTAGPVIRIYRVTK